MTTRRIKLVGHATLGNRLREIPYTTCVLSMHQGHGAQDTIDLADVTTANMFSDLTITYSGGGTSATVDVGGGDEIIFNNLTSLLDAGDFSF